MRSQEHGDGRWEQSRRAKPRPVPTVRFSGLLAGAARGADAVDPAMVLALQRELGNNATNRLLAEKRALCERDTTGMLSSNVQRRETADRLCRQEAVAQPMEPTVARALTDVETTPSPHEIYDPNASPEDRKRQEVELARSRIVQAFESIQSEHGKRVLSCILAESGNSTAEEQLWYALRLAHASYDVYLGSSNRDAEARGDQTVVANTSGAGLVRIDDEGLIQLGLDPESFYRPSGYQAALYLDLEPLDSLFDPRCFPTLRDLRAEFEEQHPELAPLAADLFPEELAHESAEREPAIQAPRYVLANRGTSSLKDLAPNVEQGVGLSTEQYEEAVMLGRTVYDKVGGRITFTGHSLGGGLASAQALATGAAAVTFNAAGLDEATIETISKPSASQRKVAAYYVEGEFLSMLQDNPVLLRIIAGLVGGAFDPAVGRRIEVSSPPVTDLNPIELHSMKTVIGALENALAEAPGQSN